MLCIFVLAIVLYNIELIIVQHFMMLNNVYNLKMQHTRSL